MDDRAPESKDHEDLAATVVAARAEAARLLAKAELQAAALRSEAAGLRFQARTEQPPLPEAEAADSSGTSLADDAMRRLGEIDAKVIAAQDEFLHFLEANLGVSDETDKTSDETTDVYPVATPDTSAKTAITAGAGVQEAEDAGVRDAGEKTAPSARRDPVSSVPRWRQRALLATVAMVIVLGSVVLLAGV